MRGTKKGKERNKGSRKEGTIRCEGKKQKGEE